jgi:hypothetical protein
MDRRGENVNGSRREDGRKKKKTGSTRVASVFIAESGRM